MTQSKLIVLLSFLCFALFIVYVFSFVFDKTTPEKITSALLNPKYVETIQSFSVETPEGFIEFILVNDVWLGVKDDMVFPLAQGMANELIENLSKTREMYVISKNTSEKELKNFALDEEQCVQIRIHTDEYGGFSSVYFGSHNFTGNKIYIRGKNTIVYEVQDEFYPWLSVVPRQWADMELIPKSLIGNVDGEDIQRAAISLNESSKVAYPTSKDFKEFTNGILSFRAGGIHSKKDVSLGNQVGFIDLDLGTGGKIVLSFYQNKIDDSVYYVDFQGQVGIVQNDKTEVINQCNYILEISSWTYERITELFNNLG